MNAPVPQMPAPLVVTESAARKVKELLPDAATGLSLVTVHWVRR